MPTRKKNKSSSGPTPSTVVRPGVKSGVATPPAGDARKPPPLHVKLPPPPPGTPTTRPSSINGPATVSIPSGLTDKPDALRKSPGLKTTSTTWAKKESSALDELDRAVSSTVAALLSAASTVVRLIQILLVKPALLLLGWAWTPIVVVGLAVGAGLLGWQALQNGVSSLTSLSFLISYTPLAALTPITCLLGIYCPPSSSLRPHGQPLNIGRLAHSLRVEASRANDIFESVIGMSDLSGAGGGLHQTEIWELAMSVKRGSKLEGKDMLAQELVDLGDLTRDLKDKLIGINSQGINSFTWILHSFAVLETSLAQLALPPASEGTSSVAVIASKKSRLALQRQLTQLISHLSSSLSQLQASVEGTIPLASRASALGGRLQEEFLVEQLTLQESLAGEPVWAPLLSQAQKAVGRLKEAGDGTGVFRRDIVKRDMRLAGETVGRLRDIRRGMEDVREELVGYRDNVGYFRAGVVGWFAGGPEDTDEIDVQSEMEGLRSIMRRFEGALKVAKSRGRTDADAEGARILGGERLGLAG